MNGSDEAARSLVPWLPSDQANRWWAPRYGSSAMRRSHAFTSADFSHGAFFFGSWVGTFFYFEDIDRGLVALGDDSGPTLFARFTLVPVPGKHHSDLN